jgi:hypothetical protein
MNNMDLNPKTLQELGDSLELNNSQISPLLRELIQNIRIPAPDSNAPFPFILQEHALQQAIKLIAVVDKLGWIEHTSDWDLGLTLEFRDGTSWEGPQGWGSEVRLTDDNKLQILKANDDPEEEIEPPQGSTLVKEPITGHEWYELSLEQTRQIKRIILWD